MGSAVEAGWPTDRAARAAEIILVHMRRRRFRRRAPESHIMQVATELGCSRTAAEDFPTRGEG